MQKLVLANWKMNLSYSEAQKLSNFYSNINYSGLIAFPPSLYLNLFQGQKIKFGAQDVSAFKKDYGAYTGEISSLMLKEIGCEFVIIGHSERRKYCLEDNITLANKVGNAIANSLIPVICVGESYEEYKLGKSYEIILKQIEDAIPNNIDSNNIIIAYEPVWAIGTGVSMDISELMKISTKLRSFIDKKFDQNIKLVYGGSVSSDNISDILAMSNINGVLVGSASLKSDEFKKIIQIAENLCS